MLLKLFRVSFGCYIWCYDFSENFGYFCCCINYWHLIFLWYQHNNNPKRNIFSLALKKKKCLNFLQERYWKTCSRLFCFRFLKMPPEEQMNSAKLFQISDFLSSKHKLQKGQAEKKKTRWAQLQLKLFFLLLLPSFFCYFSFLYFIWKFFWNEQFFF